MAVDERQRHQLYNKAVEIMGEENAEILMAHLPPGGYPNLATKQDVLDLRHWVAERFEATSMALEGRLKAHTLKTVLVCNISLAAVFAGIAFTAAGLGG